VTFSEHMAPVTAVSFLPASSACVSASLDGTVRAWDLLRYRNFRTMTTPDPVQLASLAIDPAGEVHPVPFWSSLECSPPSSFAVLLHSGSGIKRPKAHQKNSPELEVPVRAV
jgi:WD40 repeat protein